jgi:NADPH2:quinone reductase
MITGVNRSHHGHILKEVARMVDEGKITPLIHEENFTFAQANEAHALFASGKYVGKIVLKNH